MKKLIKTPIKTIATAGFIMICACLFGSIKVIAAEPTPESIINMTQVIDFAANDGRLQLYFNDGTGYYWEKGIDIVSGDVADDHLQYDENIVDMITVIDFTATEYGLQLYFEDGSGYFIER